MKRSVYKRDSTAASYGFVATYIAIWHFQEKLSKALPLDKDPNNKLCKQGFALHPWINDTKGTKSPWQNDNGQSNSSTSFFMGALQAQPKESF